MAKKVCGECKLDINDLEPLICGLCESYYHISQNCCGLNIRILKEAFTTGKAIFVCPSCRTELNGRSVRSFFTDKSNCQSNDTQPPADLPGQVQQLFEVVNKLSDKIDNFTNKSKPANIVSTPPAWPRLGAKRRREERKLDTDVTFASGTNNVDFSNLSVASVTQASVPVKFWLYLSGLNPKITDNDVQKVVSKCLRISDAADVVRLVPKDKEVANLTFVSYKIGLDPELKELALDSKTWPFGIRFREFIDFPKN